MSRRVLAFVFLAFMLFEFGSHSAVCIGHDPTDARAFSAREHSHSDPCRTMVMCPDGRRDQTLRMGHDLVPHNGLLDELSAIHVPAAVYESPVPFSSSDGLSRPPDPAFHPPEFS